MSCRQGKPKLHDQTDGKQVWTHLAAILLLIFTYWASFSPNHVDLKHDLQWQKGAVIWIIRERLRWTLWHIIIESQTAETKKEKWSDIAQHGCLSIISVNQKLRNISLISHQDCAFRVSETNISGISAVGYLSIISAEFAGLNKICKINLTVCSHQYQWAKRT